MRIREVAFVVGVVGGMVPGVVAQVPTSTPPLTPVNYPGRGYPDVGALVTASSGGVLSLTSGGLVLSGVTLTGPGIVANSNDRALYFGDPDDPFRWKRVARTGSSLPGLPAGVVLANLAGFGAAFARNFVDDQNTVAFTSGLSGTGVTTANDVALWVGSADGDLQFPNLTMVVREGDPAPGQGPGVTVSAISGVFGNAGVYSLLLTLAGPGVTTANDTLSVVGSLSNPQILVIREGDGFPGIPNTASASPGIAVDRDGRLFVAHKFFGPGVTAANDDAVSVLPPLGGGGPATWFREGEQVPGLPAGVVSSGPDAIAAGIARNRINVRCALTGPGVTAANDSAMVVGNGGGFTLVYREGDQAPGLAPGVLMGPISGAVNMNDEGVIYFPVTLTGPGVGASNDTAFFRYVGGSVQLVIREGDQMPGLPAGARFLSSTTGFVVGNGAAPLAVCVAVMNGTGVDGTNNLVLLAQAPDGSFRTFARRGSPLPLRSGTENVTNLGSISSNGAFGVPAQVSASRVAFVANTAINASLTYVADFSASGASVSWRVPPPLEANGNQGVNGTEFEPTVDIEVTHLGYFDDTFTSSVGLAAAHPVAIYPLLGSGTPAIATATIPAGTQAPLQNYFRFVALNPPVRLRAGQNYAIVGVSGGDPGHNADGSSLILGPHIVRGGWRTGPTIDTLSYPATVLNTTARFMGPTFKYRVAGARCVADVDDGTGSGTPDGGVTIEDLLFYLVLFGDGDVRADVDDGSGTGTPDGGVTIEDLLYYLGRFQDGC